MSSLTKRPRIETTDTTVDLELEGSQSNSHSEINCSTEEHSIEKVVLNEQILSVDLTQSVRKVEWNFRDETVDVDEKVLIIPPAEGILEVLDVSILTAWRKVIRKDDATKASQFVSKNLQQQLLDTRASVAEWRKGLLLGARVRANPFETIRHVFFMNRAALKIANLDAIVGFELTCPKTPAGDMMVKGGDLFYFADVCAGPGGFSEYVLWRKKLEAKGFGFTLKNTECDFNLAEFKAGTPENFEVHYGTKGDGNVLDPENVADFIKYVLENTDGHGVHLMMADGGIEVDDKNQQEDLCKGLYLAQFLVALGVVREGGNFVCKIFDMITPFSVGLIYLVYRAFDQIAIHKPNSSRSGNPERYVICKGRKSRTTTRGMYEYLTNCHEMLWNYEKNKTKGVAVLDIAEIVPMNILAEKNSGFFKYIKHTNDTLAIRQIMALKKMEAFCEDQTLTEIRQADCRRASLVHWRIPDITRKELETLQNTAKVETPALSKYNPKELTKAMVATVFKSPFDWRFVILGSGPLDTTRAFYYGNGGNMVSRFQSNYWKPIHLNIALPKDTLVYGDLVHEFSADLKETVTVFHIIDGFTLGGKDISNLHYTQRHECCVKLAKAINKPRCPETVPVRAKHLIRLEHFSTIFESITKPERLTEVQGPPSKKSKVVNDRLFPVDPSSTADKYFSPIGVLFLKITKDPWLMEYSQKAGRKYWFNLEKNQSTFDCPPTSIADFDYTMKNSVIWNWDENTQVDVLHTLISNPTMDKNDGVQAKQIVDHVDSFLAHVIPVITPPVLPFQESEDESE